MGERTDKRVASAVRARLTYANVMATVAVFLALGGGAYAFKLNANSVRSKQLAPGAVHTDDLASDAATGEKVAEDTLKGLLRPGDQAGGDLTGSVSAPLIGAGKVTPDKLAVGPAVRVETPTDANPMLSTSCLSSQGVGSSQTPLRWLGERFDTAAMHTPPVQGNCLQTLSSASRLVAPRAGIYLVAGGVVWPSSGTAGTNRFLGIRQNGDPSLLLAGDRRAPVDVALEQSISTVASLSAGDFIEAVASTSGSSAVLNFPTTTSANFLTMTWLGPAS